MGFWRGTFIISTIGLGAMLVGCEPSSPGAADDEREPHYVLGQSRVKAKDYQGAAEAFESSLEANPHSAMAHYQLAMLCESEGADPAAAIYHYQQYLRYDPKAGNAGIVNERINSCKLELAKSATPRLISSDAEQRLQQLTEENRRLQEELDKWRTAAMNTNPPPAATSVSPPAPAPAPAALPVAGPHPARPRTYTVAAGETPASIARKLGLNLNALLAANPQLVPKKMKVGQVINLPPP